MRYSDEHKNKRRVYGFLIWKSEPKEINGNHFAMLLIRDVFRKGKAWMVYDYYMSASGEALKELSFVSLNQRVYVTFQIRTKKKADDWYTTSLKALDIAHDDEYIPAWQLHATHYMSSEEANELKEKYKGVNTKPESISESNKYKPKDIEYENDEPLPF